MNPNNNNYTVERLLLDDSFLKYLAGDKRAVEEWTRLMDIYPNLRSTVEEAKSLYYTLSATRSEREKHLELEKLKHVLDSRESGLKNTSHSTKKSKHVFWYIATAVITVLSFGTYLFKNQISEDISVYNMSEKDYRLFAETNLGERKKITLPDGSVIELNGQSHISIAQDYNSSARVVKLTGEALFEVAKDKKRPFLVISGNTITKALGTSFKINNYLDREDISIALTEGSVSVKQMQDNHHVLKEDILEPGEELKVFNYKTSEKSHFNTQDILDWRNRNFSFSKSNIMEVKEKLWEIYGALIVTTNQPENKKFSFSGKFNGQSLKDVLDILALVNDFKYRISGHKVYITFN